MIEKRPIVSRKIFFGGDCGVDSTGLSHETSKDGVGAQRVVGCSRRRFTALHCGPPITITPDTQESG